MNVSILTFQKNFGKSIRTPFIFKEEGAECQEEKYSNDLLQSIETTKELQPSQRLSVYNQQYWFRLLTIMQEEYPLLQKLMNLYDFNQLVSDYLTEYPSSSPSLRYLSNTFLPFMQNSSRWNDPQLIEAATLDYIHIQCFDAAKKAPIDQEELRDTFLGDPESCRLKVQPHLFLFKESWNLVEMRAGSEKELREEAGYWLIYRDNHVTQSQPCLKAEYLCLDYIKEGLALGMVFERLEGELDEEEFDEMEKQLSNWFEHWSAQKLLVSSK